MQLKITTDYAIRALLYIAASETEPNSGEISEACAISRNLLINILQKLRKAGLVSADRGVKGGYTLVKKPDEISLYDIMSVMEESMFFNRCLESDHKCSRGAANNCAVRGYYENLQTTIHKSLSSMTLQRLLDGDVAV